MTLRYPTKNGLLLWNHKTKEVRQKRSLNPPSYNARFQNRLRDEYPEYTLVEEWKNV